MTPDRVSISEDPKSNNGKSRLRILFRVIVAVLLLVLVVFSTITYLSQPYDRTRSTFTNIAVNQGDELSDVANTLEEEGIVASAAAFSAIARLSLSTSFRPGIYYLSPSMSSIAIARTMTKGITNASGFTIPAGYSLDQISSVLERDGIADKEAFLEAAKDPGLQELDFIGKNDFGSEQVAGFLFPDKYSLDSNADESMIIMTMLNQFGNFFNDDYRARADELELSIREVVYIASMIELETSIDKEKAALSSVIHNNYNLGNLKKSEIKGTPLCSPGPESIIAALYPEDNDNLYYVYSPKLDGSHVFTDDKEEYDKMLQEYRDAMELRQEEASVKDEAK